MSIYEQILGGRFQQLQPMLRKRYELSMGKTFKATGTMKKISGGPKWMFPLFLLGTRWKFLFPEKGENIPFTIINTSQVGASGENQVHWVRAFHFPKRKRFFNALMSLDTGKNVVKDYLGEPSLLYSELIFFVTEEGHMRIKSGKQRLVLGPIEIPLPKMLQGNVQVTEYYIEESELFSIHVVITNPIIGPLFEYEGEFRADDF